MCKITFNTYTQSLTEIKDNLRGNRAEAPFNSPWTMLMALPTMNLGETQKKFNTLIGAALSVWKCPHNWIEQQEP